VLFVLIAGAVLLFGDGGNKQPTKRTASPTPTVIASMFTPEPTKIPVNNSALIALKLGGVAQTLGTLVQVDPSTLDQKVLVDQAVINQVFTWSPDNKYLGVAAKNEQGQLVFAVYGISEGKLIYSNVKLS